MCKGLARRPALTGVGEPTSGERERRRGGAGERAGGGRVVRVTGRNREWVVGGRRQVVVACARLRRDVWGLAREQREAAPYSRLITENVESADR